MRLFATIAFLAVSTAAQAGDCDKAVVQSDLNQCAQDRYDAADRALNDAWRALPDANKTALRGEERAWIAPRRRLQGRGRRKRRRQHLPYGLLRLHGKEDTRARRLAQDQDELTSRRRQMKSETLR
jgi:uncharacterized protein YecT (DUF1311 family)